MEFDLLCFQIDGAQISVRSERNCSCGQSFYFDLTGRCARRLILDRLETLLPVRHSNNLIVVDDEDRAGRPPHRHVRVREVDNVPAESICGASFSFDRFSTHKVNRYNVDHARLLQFNLDICELPPPPLKQQLRLLPTADRFLGSSPAASHGWDYTLRHR